MFDQPSIKELVQAVKMFIDDTAMPELSGHAGFHARVASNVLGTVLRDLDQRENNEAAELLRLQSILDRPNATDISTLNAVLSDAIRSGEIDIGSDELFTHLKMTAIAQLKVDQPHYSGLREALKED